MKIYQYRDYYGAKNEKIHITCSSNFLCGKPFEDWIDIDDPNQMDFSKGVCQRCNKLYKSGYDKDLNFEVIKLKLGIKC